MTSSNPNHVPKAPSPNTITLGVRALTYEFGGGHNSVYSRVSAFEAVSSIPNHIMWNDNQDHGLHFKLHD